MDQQPTKAPTVLMIGVFDVRGSTNIPMAYNLSELGVNVIPINYRTIISTYGLPYFCNIVKNTVIRQEVDLVLICKGNGIPPLLIDELTQMTRTWIFNMDPKQTISQSPEILKNATIATFSSCTAEDYAKEWKAAGANCIHLPQGIDEGIFKPVRPVKKFKADVSLIGSKTPLRDELKHYMEQAGFQVKFYGPGYGPSVYENDFAKVCSSSRFMLSMDSVAGEHTGYFSNRLLRYMACGAPTFHYEPTGTLERYFKDGEEIIYFTSPNQVVSRLQQLDDDDAYDDAYTIGMNGMDKVLKLFTWKHIMHTICTIAFEQRS